MSEQARACAAYLKDHPGYKRIMQELLKNIAATVGQRESSGWTTPPRRSAPPPGGSLAVPSPHRCGFRRHSLRRPFRSSVLGKSL